METERMDMSLMHSLTQKQSHAAGIIGVIAGVNAAVRGWFAVTAYPDLSTARQQ